jgi:hypothetical protein
MAGADLRIKSLVMWDPVIRGRDYLSRLQALSRSYYDDLDRFPLSRCSEIDAGSDELLGLSWPSSMRDSISQLDLLGEMRLQVEKVAIISSPAGEDYSELKNHLASEVSELVMIQSQDDPRWEALPSLGDALMMHETLNEFKTVLGV